MSQNSHLPNKSKFDFSKNLEDPRIRQDLRTRYDQLLQIEKELRPTWDKQSFSQKMGARFEAASSNFLAVTSVVCASGVAHITGMIAAPFLLAQAAKCAKNYDESVSPEKYYELKALEKLAIESGELKAPDKKHLAFGGDILGGGIGEYGKNLNEAIKKLAPIVGAGKLNEETGKIERTDGTIIEYTSPRNSLDNVGPITRGINQLAIPVEAALRSFMEQPLAALKNFIDWPRKQLFDLFQNQGQGAKVQGNGSKKSTFQKMWDYFLEKVFGISNESNSTNITPVNAVGSTEKKATEGPVSEAIGVALAEVAKTEEVSKETSTKNLWTNKVSSNRDRDQSPYL